ncbi:hypothetical protein DFJ74DRAFT_612633 [Hyaloraphidium curvatum]|nr:hypothetical protein DFJ74DRAFT_612633 [Hyaloraphidium curvatum]
MPSPNAPGDATTPPASPNPNDPPVPASRGSDKQSFAFPTLAKRVPVTITKVIDAVCRIYMTKGFEADPRNDGKTTADAKKIVADVGRLRYELQHDRKLEHIRDDGEGDFEEWNEVLDKYFPGATFFSATWLFVECYVYRRIREAIQLAPTWRSFDPFLESKTSSFKDSAKAVEDLVSRFWEPPKPAILSSPEAVRLLFHELVQVCLWGNSMDLSLLPNLTAETVEELQSRASSGLAAAEANILRNDIEAAWTHIGQKSGAQIDFVLDNAAFELFSDLVFADHLHLTGRAAKTVFHVKTIPWFVSDTMISDFDLLLAQLLDPAFFGFASATQTKVEALVARWKGYLQRGEWVLREHRFWCSGFAFWHIAERAPDLFEQLNASHLIIFKGDLNYRKLVYDAHWPVTTPFAEAIGPVWAGVPVLALRTNKADCIVGLDEGVEAAVLAKGDEDWRWSAKYGVVEFAK